MDQRISDQAGDCWLVPGFELALVSTSELGVCSSVDITVHRHGLRFLSSVERRWRVQRKGQTTTDPLRSSAGPKLGLDADLLQASRAQMEFRGITSPGRCGCRHRICIFQS
uniref:(northern house mosquito) hypothetical protein n=1 Tax=Culex pipiens TaxID=7175 RepID=A0A8D8DMM4_CULPI